MALLSSSAYADDNLWHDVLTFFGLSQTEFVTQAEHEGQGAMSQPIVVGLAHSSEKVWQFEHIRTDTDITVNFTHINATAFEITISANESTPNNYRWHTALCNTTQMDSLHYMEEDNQGGFEFATAISVNYAENVIDFGLPADWCGNANNAGYVLFSSGGKNQLPKSFRVITETNTTPFELYTGSGTTVTIIGSTKAGFGNGQSSFQHRLLYYPFNDRYYLLYIDNLSDLTILSANATNITQWEDPTVLQSGAFNYQGFDCIPQHNGSTNAFLHCVFSTGSNERIAYKRCEIDNSADFVNCGAAQVIFDAALLGHSTSDDVALPRISLDNQNCVSVVFDFEDASLPTVDEHSPAMIREANNATALCDDGIFSTDDIDRAAGFPDFDIGELLNGSQFLHPLGIGSYGDNDSQIFWIDPEPVGQQRLKTLYFNSSNNGTGPIVTLDIDIEGGSGNNNQYALMIGDRQLVFAQDDLTVEVDVWIVNTRNSTLSSQVNTGLTMLPAPSNPVQGLLTAVIDTRSSGEDDIYLFTFNRTDPDDIYVVNSTDGGDTWGDIALFIDDATPGVSEQAFGLDAVFNNESCEIVVAWMANESIDANNPLFIQTVANLTTQSCVVADTCTYSSGDFDVECSDNCVISSDIDLDNNDLTITGSGTFTVNAIIRNVRNFLVRGQDADNICEVTIRDGQIT